VGLSVSPSGALSRPVNRALSVVLVAFLVLAAVVVGARPAAAALQAVQLVVTSDGTGPFDSLDSGANNGVVRTHDTIAYAWNYNNGAAAATPTFTQTLNAAAGVKFNASNTTFCNGPAGGSISADGHTLTCQLALEANVSASIPISVTVDGTVPNGSVVDTTLAVRDGGTTISAGTARTTVAAQLRLELRKNLAGGFQYPSTRAGVRGMRIIYTWAVAAPSSLKGAELAAGALAWTDDLTNVAPNAVLNGCGGVLQSGVGLPYSTRSGTNNPAGSVTDSGTATCTQPGGPGGKILVSVTGADLTGDRVPTENAGGGVLPINASFLATGIIDIFVPATDINAAGGTLSTTNQFRDFDPVSISGQSNFGAGFEPGSDPTTAACTFVGDNKNRSNDNCFSANLVVGSPGTAKYLVTADDNSWVAAGGASDLLAANGVVAPNGTYWARIATYNASLNDINGVASCDVWDPATEQIVGVGRLYKNAALVTTGFTVEYASIPQTSDNGRRSLDCNTGTWYPSVTAAGGPGQVNAARLVYPGTVETNGSLNVHFQFKAMPNTNGTIIGDWASARYSNSGSFTNKSTYSKEVAQGVLGDRLTLADAVLRLTKNTVPANATSVLAGNTVKYSIQPSVTNSAPAGNVVQGVKVVDTLSSCLQYVPGTSSVSATSVAPGSNGADGLPCTGDSGETGQTLTFALGDITANSTIPAITYDTSTLATTISGTHAPNTAVISSNGTTSIDLRQRTTSYDLVILNQQLVRIAKSTDTPTVQIRDPHRYGLSWSNQTSSAIAQLQMIDVFPFNGDSRGTSYSGTTSFTGAGNIPGNAVVECTTAAPATINTDPASNTNTWSTGACGAAATAARITVTNLAVGAVGGLTLNFQATGDRDGDRYINTIGTARASGLAQPIPETAPVRVDVVASSIGDRVFTDSNGNGIQDAGEPGRSGVTVAVTGTDDTGAAITQSTTTDAAGSYRFVNLRAGTYTVAFTAPAGWEFTAPNAGTGSNDSRPPVGTATQSATPITLGIDADNLTQDAGLVRPGIDLVKTASAPADGTRYAAGENVTYTFTVTNIGSAPLSGVKVTETSFTNGAGTPLTLTSPIAASNPAPFDGTLAPGAKAVFTASYTVTQADVDAGGSIENTAETSGTSPARQVVSDTSDATIVPRTPAPAISLVKQVANTPANGTGFVAGETVEYSFTVKNTGNVTLRDVTVAEDTFVNGAGDAISLSTGPTRAPGFTGTLAPNEETMFTGTYVLTQSDVDAGGALANAATATGTPPTGPNVTDDSAASAPVTGPAAAISLVKQVANTPANGTGFVAGETVEYSFTVKNTGNVTLRDVTVAEDTFVNGAGHAITLATGPTAADGFTGSLAPNAETVFAGTYVLTQADVDAGGVLANTATTKGTPPSGPTVTDDSVASAPVVGPAAAIDLQKQVTNAPTNGTGFVVGETVEYSFTVKNTGNVTLRDVTVAEDTFVNGAGHAITLATGPTAADGFTGSLAPNAETVFTGTYVLTQTDIDAGGVLANTAVTTGTPPTGSNVTDDSAAEAPVVGPAAAISLLKQVTNAPANGTGFVAGETVNYSFTVKNTGNVTLRDVAVDEDSFVNGAGAAITLTTGPTGADGFTGILAPDEETVFTGTYVLTQADADAGGALRNSATVVGTPPTGPDVTDLASASAPVYVAPTPIVPGPDGTVPGPPQAQGPGGLPLTGLNVGASWAIALALLAAGAAVAVIAHSRSKRRS